MLQLQDEDGRILSSGHFRNEYDRVDATTLRALREHADRAILLDVRTPGGPRLTLARARPLRLGATTLWLAGGTDVTASFLESLAVADLIVALRTPADTLRAGGDAATGDVTVEETIELPYVDAVNESGGEASFIVAHANAPLAALRRRIDRWLIVAVAVTGAAALLLANWIATQVTRPLEDLARAAARVDLERLDVGFPARRQDELGTLARVLQTMTERLRGSAAQLRDAERRATVGEIARQVNHDVKNGLVPIRNVVRHLAEVARDDPAQMAPIFRDRQHTLESAVAYLESLAGNYARLSPRAQREPCDVNAILRDVARGVRHGERIRMRLGEPLPRVLGDPVALRRIFENLVVNALESLPADGGEVTVESTAAAAEGSPGVRVAVIDTGHGMAADEVRRAFEDFYSTRDRGSGLGLSIVRRLLADLGGSVRVESEPGRGSRFTVELPGALAAAPSVENTHTRDNGAHG
jgi:signal transduction histidine kinase